ncbi:MAG TPA: PAS domain S-box protein [Dissulfurispiraceae bacterium]|nr:PAS domain S-box protein [Dissulfurispiraceae bacterium]
MAQADSLLQNEFAFQHRLADGSARDVEVFSGPIWTGSKKLLFSVVKDITWRRQAEAKNKLLLQAIEQANEVVVVTDKDGAIQYVNPAFEKSSGYAKDEAAGQNMRILKSGKQDEAFYRELWGIISSGDVWRGRMVNKRKDGSLYTEEATISAVLDAGGAIVSYLAVKRDITEALRLEDEKRKLEEQLQHVQKMDAIGRLSGGIAHDFNNMLNVILGYGELVLEKLYHGDPLRLDVEQIIRAGKRSEELTRQLLTFSRKQPLQPEIIDINALLMSLEKMLRRLIGEDIDLKFSLVHDALRIKADPGQIEQVIINLAVNSRDAMPHGGTLTIETASVELDHQYAHTHAEVSEGEYVLIAVTDTGCGMDRETVSRVFEPFFTTKEKGKGTGLGLATTFGIIKQSGGNIMVYSELEQGTTFKIYLPATSAEPELKTDFHAEADRRDAGLQILLVEDEDLLRSLFAAILANLGHHVAVAANGGEALLLVEEKGLTPDLVITDVVMPGMNGAVLSERLRRSRPNLKILFMSGYTENAIVQRGVLDLDTHFIQKPFTFEAIAKKIEQVMRATERDS